MVYWQLMPVYSLYLHIPFCQHRCCYCDFNTYAGQDDLIPAYVEGLCREIEQAAMAAGERLPVHTVFFGGGTPSLLPPHALERILRALSDHFDVRAGSEITLEANPGTLSQNYLRALHGLGINRLSLGMQSAHRAELELLERGHDYGDVIRAVQWARRAGFENLSLDLIFGLPYQAMQTWQRSLELAVNLAPEHLSLYALTLEHGTPMQRWTSKGLLSEPDADLAAEMYEWAGGHLAARGYEQYEISNWSRDGAWKDRRCHHNLQYWRNLPYLGLGAGAHGFADGVRTANVLSPAAYIQRCQNGGIRKFPRTPATASVEKVDQQTEMGETMMMGLRLTQEGVSREGFEGRFGKDLDEVYRAEIDALVGSGLLEWRQGEEERLRLTVRGRLLGNRVFAQFI
jgi:oxygen-independent coproporphyrinogen-3 oxidase